MPEWLSNMSPVLQALIATVFTWFMTAAGAALVFCFQRMNMTLLDAMMNFSGGIMLAASFFSLLMPAASMADVSMEISALSVPAGFLTGALFMLLCDRICTKVTHSDMNKKRRTMLMTSITVHNIPEGLAIGVAFGSIGCTGDANLIGACMLALGIGIQNLPEGFAVSAPMIRDGTDKKSAFFMGQISGAVEIAAGLMGAALVQQVQNVLPFTLSFAAGAMIHVVIAELIPESMKNSKKMLMISCFLVGFMIMMTLDIALG